MTLIIGVLTSKCIYIASDSRGVYIKDYCDRTTAMPLDNIQKVFIRGKVGFGVGGQFANITISYVEKLLEVTNGQAVNDVLKEYKRSFAIISEGIVSKMVLSEENEIKRLLEDGNPQCITFIIFGVTENEPFLQKDVYAFVNGASPHFILTDDPDSSPLTYIKYTGDYTDRIKKMLDDERYWADESQIETSLSTIMAEAMKDSRMIGGQTRIYKIEV